MADKSNGTPAATPNVPARQTVEPTTTLGQLIAQNQKAIASVLPKHVTPERIARLALAEGRRNPKLLEADAGTFIGALIQAASLGLEPGAAGMCYLIPRYNKYTRLNEVQMQIGYKGLMKLARNSGEVGSIMAELVCDGDEFAYMLGTAPFLKHRPSTDSDRGQPTHVYAVAHLHKSDDWQFAVMTVAEVEGIRGRANEQGFSPWKTDWDEMAKKTVIRRLCKYLPMSVEIMGAIGHEEAAETGNDVGSVAFVPDGFDATSKPAANGKPRKPGLADRMAGNAGIEDAEFHDVPGGEPGE